MALHMHSIILGNGWQLHSLQQEAIVVVYFDVLAETLRGERSLKIRAILAESLGCIQG